MRALLLSTAGMVVSVGLMPCPGFSQATVDLPTLLPSAVVDLRTSEGAALVRAEWRYGDVRIVSRAPISAQPARPIVPMT